jgi:hypothetical protein
MSNFEKTKALIEKYDPDARPMMAAGQGEPWTPGAADQPSA